MSLPHRLLTTKDTCWKFIVNSDVWIFDVVRSINREIRTSKKFQFHLLVKINELASLIGFYTNNDLIYRMNCGCLNEWMCGNYTEAFSAGYVCHQTPGCLALYVILDFIWRRILKAKPSKRNVLDWTTHIFNLFLNFLSRYVWATLLTEEALDIYFFFYRRFLSTGLKMILSSLRFFFVLMTCTRWLTTQWFLYSFSCSF